MAKARKQKLTSGVAQIAAQIVEQTEAPAQTETQPEAQAQKKEKVIRTAVVTLPVSTKETKLYLITEKIGDKPRWIEKKRLSSFAKNEDGSWTIELPEPEAKARKGFTYEAKVA